MNTSSYYALILIYLDKYIFVVYLFIYIISVVFTWQSGGGGRGPRPRLRQDTEPAESAQRPAGTCDDAAGGAAAAEGGQKPPVRGVTAAAGGVAMLLKYKLCVYCSCVSPLQALQEVQATGVAVEGDKQALQRDCRHLTAAMIQLQEEEQSTQLQQQVTKNLCQL